MAEGEGAFEAQKLTIAAQPKVPEVDMTEYRFTAVSPSSQPETLGLGNFSLTDQPQKTDAEANIPEAFNAMEARERAYQDQIRARIEIKVGDPSGPGGEAEEPRPENFKATTAGEAKPGGIAAGLDGATESSLKSPTDIGSQNRSSMESNRKIDTSAPSMFEAQSPIDSTKSKQNDKT